MSKYQIHYIYKIHFLCGFPSGRYYIGKRTYHGRDLSRDKYTGSGNFCAAYFKKYGTVEGETYIKEILEINPSGEINKDREDFWIGDLWKTDPLCMNQTGARHGCVGDHRKRPNSTKRVKINQYDLTGKYIKTWDCVGDILEGMGYTEHARSRLWEAYTKKNKTAFGYLWRRYNGSTEDIDPGKIADVKGKPVKQYTLDGKFIQSFPSAESAAKSIGKPSANIKKVVKGKAQYAYGYVWRYEKDPFDKYPISKIPKVSERGAWKTKVNQYTKDGRFIKTWDSISDAAREINGKKKAPDVLSAFLSGKIKNKANVLWGYKWEYYDNWRKGLF